VKTIGVLGGLGPQATMDFERRIHRISQDLIPHDKGAGYPPMVVYYCRHAPVLVGDDGVPRLPLRVDPRLLEVAKRIGTWADFLVVTSNSPHLFQAEIEKAAGCPVLSMIDVTLEHVRRRSWRRVGVLGRGEPVVYTRRLDGMDVAFEVAEPELRAELDRAIFAVMEGRDDAISAAVARRAVDSLRARRVDGVILGCTEIPLLLGTDLGEPDLVNPAALLAEAAVRAALGSS
jgi:aspartate racemase